MRYALCPLRFLNLNSDSETEMEKWKCKICGYIYDPEKGDADGNIPPGTPFAKLPDDWVCPVCGAPKDMFEQV
jgi:rubredoxin